MVSARERERRQLAINQAVWRDGDFVQRYAGRALTPAEVAVLVRYREPLSGRTLELGCGAGRILGHLATLGGDAHGVDISPRMVDYCRREYPRAHVRLGDLCEPRSCGEGRFDAIWVTAAALGLLDDFTRRRVLRELAAMIESNGILVFSAHNLGAPPAPGGGLGEAAGVLRGPWTASLAWRVARKVLSITPRQVCDQVALEVRRRRHRRALRRYAHRGEGYAILNDSDLEHRLLHYYIGRDDQERQLAELGYALVECVDETGAVLAAGQTSPSRELYYVAYPR